MQYHLITDLFVIDAVSVRNGQLFILCNIKKSRLFSMHISLNLLIKHLWPKKDFCRNVMEYGGWLSKVESNFSSLT